MKEGIFIGLALGLSAGIIAASLSSKVRKMTCTKLGELEETIMPIKEKLMDEAKDKAKSSSSNQKKSLSSSKKIATNKK